MPQYDDVKQLTEALPVIEKMVADGKTPSGKVLSKDDIDYYSLISLTRNMHCRSFSRSSACRRTSPSTAG